MIVLVSATTLMSLYLQVTKQVVKFMATEKLENTQLIKVRVEKNKINWVEEAHELRINGQLFDVKSYTVLSNGDIICKGIYDSAEDAIAASTGKLFDQKNSKTTKILISKITSLVFEKEQPKKYLEAVIDTNNIRYPLLPTPLTYLTKKITTPPPKC
jgi:hypothetical protein